MLGDHDKEQDKRNAPRLTARGHLHGEAFCLMTYECNGKHIINAHDRFFNGGLTRTRGCGHREIYWNSRDGVTPFGKMCPSCGGDLMHINFRADVYAPDHKPWPGQGIWRDGTPDEAEQFMWDRIKQFEGTEYAVNDARAKELIAAARSEGQTGEFQKGWPMFTRYNPREEG
jgi:hypothetical protein